MKSKNGRLLFLFLAVLFLFSSGPAYADKDQIKLYRKAYPEEKPTCFYCHVDKTPKKEDGKHDLNAYGKSVLAISSKPDETTYKKAGNAPVTE